MGLPPSSGFLAKWQLIDAALTQGHWQIAVIVLAGVVGPVPVCPLNEGRIANVVFRLGAGHRLFAVLMAILNALWGEHEEDTASRSSKMRNRPAWLNRLHPAFMVRCCCSANHLISDACHHFEGAKPVIDDLGLDETVTDLAGQVTVTNPTSTAFVNIAVVDGDPKQAADIANSLPNR